MNLLPDRVPFDPYKTESKTASKSASKVLGRFVCGLFVDWLLRFLCGLIDVRFVCGLLVDWLLRFVCGLLVDWLLWFVCRVADGRFVLCLVRFWFSLSSSCRSTVSTDWIVLLIRLNGWFRSSFTRLNFVRMLLICLGAGRVVSRWMNALQTGHRFLFLR